MIEAGSQRRDDDRREVADEEHHDDRGEQRAEEQVLLERRDRRVDEPSRRGPPSSSPSPAATARPRRAVRGTPSITDTVFSPIARRTSSITAGVSPSHTAEVGRSKLSSAWPMSEMRIGVPSLVATTMSLKFAVASTRPSVRSSSCPCPARRCRPGSRRSRRRWRRAPRHRQAVGVQLLDVDDDVDLAGAAAGQADLADAVDGLDGAGDLLVGELGERPQAHAR